GSEEWSAWVRTCSLPGRISGQVTRDVRPAVPSTMRGRWGTAVIGRGDERSRKGASGGFVQEPVKGLKIAMGDRRYGASGSLAAAEPKTSSRPATRSGCATVGSYPGAAPRDG